MKKVFAILLVSVFAFAMVACGDDDDGASFDNVTACQDLEDTINGLECYAGYEVDMTCDTYEDYTCDVADYFNCTADCYGCDGDVPTFDSDTWSNDCVPLAECA